ncbi:TRAP transporter substrate-binding protein [Phreatobacter sp.]|uniref:TRAP transporter substrate-binding protein n=1 Tax=Phreatobacter sp. TaxID=1966341 RepID=UPI003F715759
MILTRRHALAFAGAAVATPAVMRTAWGQSPQVTLRLHHFLPPVSNAHQRFLLPWSRNVETASGGRIKVDIFPSMQLGGAPPQLYDQARDGVMDIVWTLPGNTPGRFPATEAMELPFIAGKRAVTNSKAMADLFPVHFAKDYAETQILCIWAHDHGLIHSSKQVRTQADLSGLKLRFPTRQAGEALRALGATAIGMPIPQVPEALAQGVIDGAVVPWEVVPALRLHELVRHHTEIPGSPTLYTATFVLAMNKAKYNGLPADLKKVIDDHSGMVAATMAGGMWDDRGHVVSEMVKQRPRNTITVLAEDEVAKWRTATKGVEEAWIRAVKDRGLDGQKIVDDVRAAVAKHMVA